MTAFRSVVLRSPSGSFLCVFPQLNGLGLRCGFAFRCVLWRCSVVCSSSICVTLFLGWTFFHQCHYLLRFCASFLLCGGNVIVRSLPRSDQRFSLATGSHVGMSQFCFHLVLCPLPLGVSSGRSWLLPGFRPWLCLQGFSLTDSSFLLTRVVFGFFSLSSSSMASYRSLLGGVFHIGL